MYIANPEDQETGKSQNKNNFVSNKSTKDFTFQDDNPFGDKYKPQEESKPSNQIIT